MSNLTIEDLKKAAFGKKSARTRPIGNITFAINYYFHEYHPTGYHIVNIVIHILCSFFLFLLIRVTLEIHESNRKDKNPGDLNKAEIKAGKGFLGHQLYADRSAS